MPAAIDSAARWTDLVERHRGDAAADLLVAFFERWARTDDAVLRDELAAIVRDPGDGSVLTEWRRTFEVDREAFLDVARNWAEDCREA